MKPLHKILIGIICCLLLAQVKAGNDKEQIIDSLQSVIASEDHDTTKIKAYIQWDNLIFKSDPKLDRELNFKIVTICTENLLLDQTEKERYFFQINLAKAFNNLGQILKEEGNLFQALAYHKQSLSIRKDINDRKGQALSLMNIGAIFHVQGDLVRALEYYYESLKIREEIGDTKGQAGILNNIGAVYHYQRDYSSAIKFYYESLNLRKKLQDDVGVGNCYSNLGLVYFEQADSLFKDEKIPEAHQKLDLALEHHLASLGINKTYGLESGIGSNYNNIGLIYYKKGKLEIALDYFKLAKEIKEEKGDKSGLASALCNMANIYNDQNKLDLAVQCAEQAYQFATEGHAIIETQSASLILYKLYKKLNQHKTALFYHEQYLSIKDSISNREKNSITIQQQFKYEYEKKAAADSIVQSEQIKVKNAELAAKNAESEKDKLEIERQKEQKYYLFGGIGLIALFGLFMANRVLFIQRQKRIIETQKNEVEQQKSQIEHQHFELEETHKEISDSIRYAERLQRAILPSRDDLNAGLKDGFVIFEPKDVVSGDFYWLQSLSDSVLFAAADCTGHGVPGAMVSVVCSNALNRTVNEFGITSPAAILNKTRELVVETFARSGKDVKDGMDIALCKIQFNQEEAILTYAGANNPLWLWRADQKSFEEIKADKQPIGKFERNVPFSEHSTTLQKGDSIYVFSDGYVDQFGGEKGKKLKSRLFKEKLIGIQSLSMDDQKIELKKLFEEWKGDFEQVDDVTVIGIRI